MARDTEQGARPEQAAGTPQPEKPKRAKSKKTLVKQVNKRLGKKNDEHQATRPEQAAATAQPEKPKRAKSKKTLVKQVIKQFGEKIEHNELKPTVGDFIRLLQLEKELLEETPKEIKVSWVEPDENAPEK